MLPNVVRRPPGPLRYLPVALFLIGLSFLLVGFARPQQLLNTSKGNGATIVLTFDVSGSMAADDVSPTRLRAARQIAIQFLNELPSKYRVAVVTIADSPHLVVPPTRDRRQVIAGLPTKVTPLAGTAIGDGVSYSVAVIGTAAGPGEPGALRRPGAVVLFSDGGQNAGGTTPQEAVVTALVDYVPVDTIAVGTAKGIVTQPVKVLGQLTSTQIAVPVQPAILHALSQQTGGTLFEGASAAHSPPQLASIYKGLLPHTSPDRKTHSWSAPTAAIALVFILAGIALPGLWFGRVP